MNKAFSLKTALDADYQATDVRLDNRRFYSFSKTTCVQEIEELRPVFVRAEYRGFVYNSPTYNLTSLDGTDRITQRAEPSIGFGDRF